MPEFVNLHNHFHTSVLDGFGTTEESLNRIQENNQKAVGLTDHGNVFGVHDFIKKARERNIIPVPGVEAYFAPLNPEGARAKTPIFYGKNGIKSAEFDVSANGAYLHQTIWAYNNEGMKNLFKLVSTSNKKENFYQAPRMDFEMLAEHSEGLIVGTGCPSSEISTRFLLNQDKEAYEFAGRLKEVFKDRLFVEIMDHSMSIDLERRLLPKQLELAKKLNLPLLATNDSHYANPHDAVHHEEMLCTQSGARMSDKTYDEGGPRFSFEGTEYYLKTAEEMEKIFPKDQFPNAISNTLLVAEMAQDIRLDFDPTLKVKASVPKGYNEVTYLKSLIQKGLKERYSTASLDVKKEALERVKEEFEVLHSSDFIGYILTVYEYLQWTKDNFSTYNPENEVIASPIGAGRGCFLPDNLISTEHGLKQIKEMGEEKVKTFDGELKKVKKVFKYPVENEPCIEIILDTGERITCTSDHKLYVKNKGFLPSSEILNSDILIGERINDEKSSTKFSETPLEFSSQKLFKKPIKLSTPEELFLINLLETDSNVQSFDNTETFYMKDGNKVNTTGFIVNYNNGDKEVFVSSPTPIKTENFTTLTLEDLQKKEGGHLERRIKEINKFNYTGEVYDLEVEGARNYLVANVTAHNSVGGSIIAFLLGISEVDPIKHDLLFSRFLSAGRGATYEITYDDGTTEEIVVSEKKKVKGRDGKIVYKYIHQLEIGDEVV